MPSDPRGPYRMVTVMLAKVANKDTLSVVSALIKQARKLRSEL
jgi:hypothetical protein